MVAATQVILSATNYNTELTHKWMDCVWPDLTWFLWRATWKLWIIRLIRRFYIAEIVCEGDFHTVDIVCEKDFHIAEIVCERDLRNAGIVCKGDLSYCWYCLQMRYTTCINILFSILNCSNMVSHSQCRSTLSPGGIENMIESQLKHCEERILFFFCPGQTPRPLPT